MFLKARKFVQWRKNTLFWPREQQILVAFLFRFHDRILRIILWVSDYRRGLNDLQSVYIIYTFSSCSDEQADYDFQLKSSTSNSWHLWAAQSLSYNHISSVWGYCPVVHLIYIEVGSDRESQAAILSVVTVQMKSFRFLPFLVSLSLFSLVVCTQCKQPSTGRCKAFKGRKIKIRAVWNKEFISRDVSMMKTVKSICYQISSEKNLDDRCLKAKYQLWDEEWSHWAKVMNWGMSGKNPKQGQWVIIGRRI